MFDNTLMTYIPTFKAKKIGIICAAANAMGLLSSFGPPDWNPATQHIRDICTEAREYCKLAIVQDPYYSIILQKIGVELGKLAVYHTLQQKGPDTVLIGMNKRNVLEYNLDVLYNGLTQKEHEAYTEVMKYVYLLLLTMSGLTAVVTAPKSRSSAGWFSLQFDIEETGSKLVKVVAAEPVRSLRKTEPLIGPDYTIFKCRS
ncbi:hypothetical protein NQ317_012716, partial [Molorchus minor]